MKKFIFLFLLIINSLACRTYTVTKVTDSNRSEVKGLRFFLPSPYLLVAEKDLLIDGLKTVTEDKTGKTSTVKKMAVARRELQCRVIYLPNPQEEYSIETLSGKVSQSISLEDGWKLCGINKLQGKELSSAQLNLISGTEGLQPGVYAVLYKDSHPYLKKVAIVP